MRGGGREGEREKERERRGGREREKQTTLRQNHSTSTVHQSMGEIPFIKKVTPQAPTRKSTRKPTRLTVL
jgi:hypothetical protein